MKMFTRDGIEMLDVKSIDREGENLVLKGKMMGTMSTAIYLRPEDLWQALRLLSWRLILSLPLTLGRGCWRTFRSARASRSAAK
jgi:hypothetical protein